MIRFRFLFLISAVCQELKHWQNIVGFRLCMRVYTVPKANANRNLGGLLPFGLLLDKPSIWHLFSRILISKQLSSSVSKVVFCSRTCQYCDFLSFSVSEVFGQLFAAVVVCSSLLTAFISNFTTSWSSQNQFQTLYWVPLCASFVLHARRRLCCSTPWVPFVRMVPCIDIL
jgi:hypothetical protein